MPPLRSDRISAHDHKKQLAAMLDNLGRPERVKMIETYLNKVPDATTEGLPAVLLSMTSVAVSCLVHPPGKSGGTGPSGDRG